MPAKSAHPYLYVFGDQRITKVIEDHKDDVLLNPDWMKDEDEVQILYCCLLCQTHCNALMVSP